MGTLYRIRIKGGTPGDLVDLYQTSTGERIATGVIDANDDCQIEYPASLGPAHHVARHPGVADAQPWQANTAYVNGDLITSDHWGGWMLKCAIGGISGVTEPDDSHRMIGQVHRPVYAAKATAGARRSDGVSAGGYGYTSLNNNTAHDGNPHSWHATLVDAWVTESEVFGLLNDGTVRFSGISATNDAALAHGEAGALSNIVKLYGYKHGIFARDTADNLHHICSYSRSTYKPNIDTLLSNYPTAVAAFVGAQGNEITLILADGTAISLTANMNTRLAGMTDIHCGVQNSYEYFLALCEGGARVRGWEDGGVIDLTTGYPGKYLDDPIDELQANFSCLSYTTRAGNRGRFLCSGTAWDDQESIISYVNGPPPVNFAWGAPYGSSADQYGTYLMNRHSAVAIHPPSGFSSALRAHTDALVGNHLDLGGHPIIRDGGVTWHLIAPPAEANLPSNISQTFESTASVPVGTISGTLSVNQVAAERPVLALHFKDGQPEILASGASDENGDFSLTMAGQTEPVYVLAIDQAGPAWSAGTAITGGVRMIPSASAHTGLVYECTSPGATGTLEPAWPADIGSSVIDGTVTWEAISYFQPQAHGPVHPVVSGEPDDIEENGNTYAYSEQTTADNTTLQVFANDQDGSDLIYRRLIAPADIVDGDTWTYTRTLDAGHFWADEYENTIDNTDLIYRLLDGSVITGELPLTLDVPNGSFEDATRWITTLGSVTYYYGASQTGAHTGDRFILGGSNAETRINQDIDFAADVGLPAWAWHGHNLAVRWQQSSYSGQDQGQVKVKFLDDQGATISTFQSVLHAAIQQIWTFNQISAPVPANAVGINIEIIFDRNAGSVCDGYFDSLDLYLST